MLLAAIPVVHDLKIMITAPYWLDEAWVALSVRMPLADLPVTTSSSPIGWTFLLRLVPDSNFLRVVPLVFHGLAVVTAYALGRLLRWPNRWLGAVAGLVCGGLVLLLPAQQVRHDLKQYTADAAVTVGLIALGAWVEARWSHGRLAALAAAVGVGMLFSHVTAIAAPCVFAGLLLVTVVRREWIRLVEGTLAGLVGAWVAAAVYFEFSAQGRSEEMQQFWAANFPRFTELPAYLSRQVDALAPVLGAPLLVMAALIVAGVVTLVKRDRAASAIAVGLLPVAATTLGVAKVYPLLELRTSHFLVVTTAAVAGIGVAGVASWAAERIRRALPGVRPAAAAAVVCAIMLGTFIVGNTRWYRFDGNEPGFYYTPISVTDIRSATRYVARHRAPNDVVLMNNSAWYGFAFYSKHDRVELIAPHGNTVGWWVHMPARPDVVVVPGHTTSTIRASLNRAMELAGQRGPGARVWLIRSHVVGDEAEAWGLVLADYRVELVTDGVEPVALVSRG